MSDDGALPPDDVLVGRLSKGDESAFEQLLDAWSASMLRLARSFVSTNASAEEVVQETWLAVIRGIDGFEGRAALKTWVFRILVNTAKKRGLKERRTLPFGSLTSEDEGPTVDPSRFRSAGDPYPGHWLADRKPQRWSEPEIAAERAEIMRVVAAALAELPDRNRIVITLRDMEGYSSDEVCELLDISQGNQRVILHRSRAAVRVKLEHYFDAERGIHRGL
ncbi:RNA polymerase sigma factor [Nocardia sp. NBC_01327]|uniref:RNA polymerase sigma factor n=1 Tax=Nocardia sp. NBC_01327 TaxID=2903593 RepID=UPI002E14C90F|nr:sigma-70 family RNA polymerase sigma factor [Nocardia sp. NBC_01327]